MNGREGVRIQERESVLKERERGKERFKDDDRNSFQRHSLSSLGHSIDTHARGCAAIANGSGTLGHTYIEEE